MLIVLWLLMLLHGRISGITKPLSFNAGLIVANTIVALAWFGVNLLGVGLHSYGFTDSIAGNLSLFCRIEIILAAVFYFWASHRQSKGVINVKLFSLNLILPFVWVGLNLSGVTIPYWEQMNSFNLKLAVVMLSTFGVDLLICTLGYMACCPFIKGPTPVTKT